MSPPFFPANNFLSSATSDPSALNQSLDTEPETLLEVVPTDLLFLEGFLHLQFPFLGGEDLSFLAFDIFLEP